MATAERRILDPIPTQPGSQLEALARHLDEAEKISSKLPIPPSLRHKIVSARKEVKAITGVRLEQNGPASDTAGEEVQQQELSVIQVFQSEQINLKDISLRKLLPKPEKEEGKECVESKTFELLSAIGFQNAAQLVGVSNQDLRGNMERWKRYLTKKDPQQTFPDVDEMFKELAVALDKHHVRLM